MAYSPTKKKVKTMCSVRISFPSNSKKDCATEKRIAIKRLFFKPFNILFEIKNRKDEFRAIKIAPKNLK